MELNLYKQWQMKQFLLKEARKEIQSAIKTHFALLNSHYFSIILWLY